MNTLLQTETSSSAPDPTTTELACDYDGLKTFATDHGITVKDLLVLAPQNDPFYAGAPTSRINGEWFAKIWDTTGFVRGVHIRRVHYAIISASEPSEMPNGKPYVNTEECWMFLNAASKSARYLGLVDHEAFDDRKNPPAIIKRPPEVSVGSFWINRQEQGFCLPGELQVPAIIGPSLPTIQRYHLEVWCEKTTMNDVLIPLCARYGANLVTGAGELSTTAIRSY